MGQLLTRAMDEKLRKQFEATMAAWLSMHSEMTGAELVLLEWELHSSQPVPPEMQANVERLRAEGQKRWNEVLQVRPDLLVAAVFR